MSFVVMYPDLIRIGTSFSVKIVNGTTVPQPYTAVEGADDIIVMDLITPAASRVNLPTSPATGTRFIIKDGAQNASSYTVTVAAGGSETIDGVAAVAITQNAGTVTVIFNGTEWNTI